MSESVPLATAAASAVLLDRAQQLAAELTLPCAGVVDDITRTEQPLLLYLTEAGLQLQVTGRKAPGPVWADFVTGAVAHRRKFGGGSGQMIAKAVGIKPGVRPRVLDATAGLGKDSFVLATLGCEMTLIERSPLFMRYWLMALLGRPMSQRWSISVRACSCSLLMLWSG